MDSHVPAVIFTILLARSYKSAGDISRLERVFTERNGITNANPGCVSTDLTHGYNSTAVLSGSLALPG